MKRLLLLVAGTVLLAVPVQAQSVAGEWDAQINTPGGIRSTKVIFQVSGDKLTGVVQRATDTLPLTGTITGDTVRYSYTINYEGSPLELTVTARLSGDSLEGTVSFGGLAEGAFSAKRARRPPGGVRPTA